ncbi:reverse transcriptase domain-containing protein, partial [Tanacetum coccineum]
FGLQKLIRNDDDVYLFNFSSQIGVEQVLERGSWMIRKSPITLNKWSPSLSLKKGEVTKVPVWVKLYGVLVFAYSDDGLSLIATQIGKPIMLDTFTGSMCVDLWGRISFARALIEVSLESLLKTKVVMYIPNDEDDKHTKEVIRVEYEWKPPHCIDCKKFRHSHIQCPKQVKEPTPSAPSGVATHASNVDEQDEGFTETSSLKDETKNTVEDDVGGSGDKRTDPINGSDSLSQNISDPIGSGSLKVVADKVQEEDSLWSHFQRANMASTNKSIDYVDESDEDEV